MADVATPLRELVALRATDIKAIARRHGAVSVAVFGSVARGEDRPGSDIDLLVELEPGTRPIELLALGVDLEDLLGVSVDVGTVASLRPHIRDEVLVGRRTEVVVAEADQERPGQVGGGIVTQGSVGLGPGTAGAGTNR